MIKTFLSLLCSVCCILSFGQDAINIALNQKQLKDDFLVENGQYSIYFHKADMLSTIDEMDKKLKTDNAAIRQQINSGTLKDADITPQSASNNAIKKIITSSLGSYLLLKGKATVYKDNNQLIKISVEESPPETELDGTMSNIFHFAEAGTNNWIFHGGVRTELRK